MDLSQYIAITERSLDALISCAQYVYMKYAYHPNVSALHIQAL